MRVILDTNFLLIPVQFKVDIVHEIKKIMHVPFELCVMRATVEELKNIQKTQKGKDKDAAAFALRMIDKVHIKVLKSGTSYADQAILEAAKPKTHIVATQDRLLKKQLQEKGVPLLVMRQKKKVMFLNTPL